MSSICPRCGVSVPDGYVHNCQGVTDLQASVFEAVSQRGYDPPFHKTRLKTVPGHPFALAQVLKAWEEMGEVARHLFEDRYPPVDELADVVIPLLCLAEYLGYDLLAAVREKSTMDVARGTRV